MSETRVRRRRRVAELQWDPHTLKDAKTVLRTIRINLSQVNYFRIEDLMRLPRLLHHITSITRYNNIRLACNYLCSSGELVRLSRTDMALAKKAGSYEPPEHPLHDEYLDTIRGLVQEMPRRQLFGVMDVVDTWRSDTHLSTTTKQVAVRYAMTKLVKEKVCRRRNEYEFSV